MKFVKLNDSISVNPDHVASVVETISQHIPSGVTIVMANGQKHGIPVAELVSYRIERKGELLQLVINRLEGKGK